jgi:hypothetical protein
MLFQFLEDTMIRLPQARGEVWPPLPKKEQEIGLSSKQMLRQPS